MTLECTLFLNRTLSRKTAIFEVLLIRRKIYHVKTDFRFYFVSCRHLLSCYLEMLYIYYLLILSNKEVDSLIILSLRIRGPRIYS